MKRKPQNTTSDPMNIRIGVQNLGSDTMVIVSTHPQKFLHPLSHARFVVPPRMWVEMPHRWYDFTVNGQAQPAWPIAKAEGDNLDEVKSRHPHDFVYRID